MLRVCCVQMLRKDGRGCQSDSRQRTSSRCYKHIHSLMPHRHTSAAPPKPAAQNTATPRWAAAHTQASWCHPSVWVPSAKLPTYTELGSDTVSGFPEPVENKKAPIVRGLEPMCSEVAKRRQTAAAQFM